MDERGHVAAEFGPQLHQFGARPVQLPEAVEPADDACGVRAAAAEAPADGDALVDVDARARVDAVAGLHEPCRADGEVLVHRADLGEVHAGADREGHGGLGVGGGEGYGVRQADGHHDAAQLVVAVRPLAEDLQGQVDLGRGFDCFGGTCSEHLGAYCARNGRRLQVPRNAGASEEEGGGVSSGR